MPDEKKPTPPPERRPIEKHRDAKKTPEWLFRAAKAQRHWAQGAEVTEADFDLALKEAGSIRINAR